MPDDKNQNTNTEDKTREIEELKRFIFSAEDSLEAAKKALLNLTGEDLSRIGKSSLDTGKLEGLTATPDGKVIEGIFNGENMIGPDEKVFPVPANYASKSKLIEGDRLKLTIAEDGSFIFKQIGPAPRKSLVGTLNFENNAYHVLAEGKSYGVLYASVTYYKAKAGDRVTIIVPEDGNSEWACLDNIIHDVVPTAPEENILDDELDIAAPVDNIQPVSPVDSPENNQAPGVETPSAPSTELPDLNIPPTEDIPAPQENVAPEPVLQNPEAPVSEPISQPQESAEPQPASELEI